ncbi:unnamed protein product [Bursaphelenchus xylophilus]|uniref:(pine wood nematode) hypothetical protein n=1 Tax=Bursaphelenchus xylophilus TaxID=6326 RepID=A0A1I7SEM4_BURXY|nr:unnamed protein product [Bursaphelenchus xylophilus]CAG9113650.1 unnamed protein product [Bursaphelenchus xylophilus]
MPVITEDPAAPAGPSDSQQPGPSTSKALPDETSPTMLRSLSQLSIEEPLAKQARKIPTCMNPFEGIIIQIRIDSAIVLYDQTPAVEGAPGPVIIRNLPPEVHLHSRIKILEFRLLSERQPTLRSNELAIKNSGFVSYSFEGTSYEVLELATTTIQVLGMLVEPVQCRRGVSRHTAIDGNRILRAGSRRLPPTKVVQSDRQCGLPDHSRPGKQSGAFGALAPLRVRNAIKTLAEKVEMSMKTPSNDRTTTLTHTMSLLGKFNYDPDHEHSMNEEYVQLKGRTSPNTPESMEYKELLRTLKEIFGPTKSLFRRRHETLSLTLPPGKTAGEALNEANIRGDKFEFTELDLHQFKIFLTLQFLKDPSYKSLRSMILKAVDQKPDIAIDELRKVLKSFETRMDDVNLRNSLDPRASEGHNDDACRKKKSSHLRFNNITINNVVSEDTGDYVTLQVNSISTKFRIDSGADMTVIGPETWKHLNRPTLTPFKIPCQSVDGSSLSIKGSFTATLETTLLSGKASKELGIITLYNKGKANINVVEPYAQTMVPQYTENFEEELGQTTNTLQIAQQVKEDEPQILQIAQQGKEDEPQILQIAQQGKEDEPQILQIAQQGKEDEPQILQIARQGKEEDTKILQIAKQGKEDETQILQIAKQGKEDETQILQIAKQGKEDDT